MANTSIGVMLDLDDTLVVSRAIEVLRRNRQWNKCYEEFSRTYLPEGIHAFLQELREFAACGVVTMAPRAYAERLIAFHQLNLDVLVAYHDVKARKPYPEPLLLGAQKLGVPIERCVYIGDSEIDVIAAQRAGAKPLSVCWAGNGSIQVLHNWSEVLLEIEKFKRGQE